MSDPETDELAEDLAETYNDLGWRGVAVAAIALRDAREKTIVDRLEHYLEALIGITGQANPTLSVRDVRAHLFEVPQ